MAIEAAEREKAAQEAAQQAIEKAVQEALEQAEKDAQAAAEAAANQAANQTASTGNSTAGSSTNSTNTTEGTGTSGTVANGTNTTQTGTDNGTTATANTTAGSNTTAPTGGGTVTPPAPTPIIDTGSSIQVTPSSSGSSYALQSDNTQVIQPTLNEDSAGSSSTTDWVLIGLIVGASLLFLFGAVACVLKLQSKERRRLMDANNRMIEQRDRIEKKLKAK